MLPQVRRFLNRTQCRQCTDFYRAVGLWSNAAQFCDSPQVQYMLWLKQFLPHGRNQVRATSQHAKIARVSAKKIDRLFYGVRPK
jgi:hypothetical protein